MHFNIELMAPLNGITCSEAAGILFNTSINHLKTLSIFVCQSRLPRRFLSLFGNAVSVVAWVRMWVCGRPKLNHVFIVTFAIKAARGPADRKRIYTGAGAGGVIRCCLSCRHTWNGWWGVQVARQVGKPDKS